MRRACAEPSAALNGYDGTALLHHAAYAARYTTRSATRQATVSYAASYAWRGFDKTGQGHAGRKICAGQCIHANEARKS